MVGTEGQLGMLLVYVRQHLHVEFGVTKSIFVYSQVLRALETTPCSGRLGSSGPGPESPKSAGSRALGIQVDSDAGSGPGPALGVAVVTGASVGSVIQIRSHRLAGLACRSTV